MAVADALLGARPVGRADRGEGGLEHRPLLQVRVADPAQQRLQLGQHLAQRAELAQVGVGVLQPVEAGRERGLVVGAAGRGDRAPARSRGHRRTAAGCWPAPRARTGCGPAWPGRRAPRRCAARRCRKADASAIETATPACPPSSRSTVISRLRCPARRAASRAARRSSNAGWNRLQHHPGPGPGQVGPGQRLRSPAWAAASSARPASTSASATANRRVACSAASSSAATAPDQSSARPGVGGDELRRPGEQLGRPPVVRHPGRQPAWSRRSPPAPGRWRTRSCGRPPPAAGPRRPPRSAGRPGAGARRSSRRPWPGRPWRRAPHRPAAAPRWPDRPGAAGPAPPAAATRGRPGRRPRARAASRRRTGCARGSARMIVSASSCWPASAASRATAAAGSGPRSSRSVTSASASSAARPPRPGSWRAPATGVPAELPGQVVQQLDGGEAGVVQVVEHEQGRPVGGQPAQHVGDGVVGPAELELRRCRAPAARAPSTGSSSGSSVDERGRLRAGQLAQPVGGGRRQRPGERVEEGLQEQRLLAGVAAAAQHRAAGRPASAASAAASRVLPMPPSPATSSTPADPAQAAPHAAVSRSSSTERPTRSAGSGCGRGRCPARQAPLAVRRPVLAQDGQVQRPGLRIRVDAQLGGQLGAQPLVAGQRPGRLAGQLVRRHQQAVRHLVEPVGGDRGLGGVPRPRPGSPAAQPAAAAACRASRSSRTPSLRARSHPVRVRLAGEHGRRARARPAPPRPRSPRAPRRPRRAAAGPRSTRRRASSRSTRTDGGRPSR